MNDHDKLRALVSKWRERVAFCEWQAQEAKAAGANDSAATASTNAKTLAKCADELEAALAALGGKGEARDREADRARFPDADFNRWLDEAISDCGHIVWHQIVSIEDAWAAWDSRPYYAKGRHPLADAPEDDIFATQPEAQGEAEDFHDILYGAKLKILLDPENDSSAVSGCVGATFGSNDGLEIMLHAVDADGGVVKLHTAAPKPVEGVTDGWQFSRIASPSRDGDRWEIYNPQGSGGIVSTHFVKDWVVRELLDALTAAQQQGESDKLNKAEKEQQGED